MGMLFNFLEIDLELTLNTDLCICFAPGNVILRDAVIEDL